MLAQVCAVAEGLPAHEALIGRPPRVDGMCWVRCMVWRSHFFPVWVPQGLAKGQALAEGLPTGTALIGLLCSVDLLVVNEMSST